MIRKISSILKYTQKKVWKNIHQKLAATISEKGIEGGNIEVFVFYFAPFWISKNN